MEITKTALLLGSILLLISCEKEKEDKPTITYAYPNGYWAKMSFDSPSGKDIGCNICSADSSWIPGLTFHSNGASWYKPEFRVPKLNSFHLTAGSSTTDRSWSVEVTILVGDSKKTARFFPNRTTSGLDLDTVFSLK